MISQKMAGWIRRSAKIKGMTLSDGLKQLIDECLADADVEGERVPASSAIRSSGAVEMVLFEELSVVFANAAKRLRGGS